MATKSGGAPPNTWEHAVEALEETTSYLLVCNTSDQAGIEGLVELRATALGELMALDIPCPVHLVSALEKVREDGDKACSRLDSFKNEMHSELAGLLQVRSILHTGVGPLPSVIDFSA